jgi:MYXO-CTERM domain-containing protein
LSDESDSDGARSVLAAALFALGMVGLVMRRNVLFM